VECYVLIKILKNKEVMSTTNEEEKKEANEAHRYWQNMALKQLSDANNWMLVAATTFLSFGIACKDISVQFSLCNIDWALTLYVVFLWLSIFSIFTGCIVLISRLFDFRITRTITDVKKRFYKKAENTKFPEVNNKEPNCCEKVLTFLHVICNVSLPKFSSDDISILISKGNEKKYNSIITDLSNLRQTSHTLGKITWSKIRHQVIFFVFAVVAFIIHIFI
jgi:hypothetical protein